MQWQTDVGYRRQRLDSLSEHRTEVSQRGVSTDCVCLGTGPVDRRAHQVVGIQRTSRPDSACTDALGDLPDCVARTLTTASAISISRSLLTLSDKSSATAE